ncbi:Protein HflC [Gammaproteobacteria bacterium]
MQKAMNFLVAVAILVGGGLFFSLFTVQQWQRALVMQFGEVQRIISTPGLYFKLPLINHVYYFDGRILSLDAEPERYLTSEKKNVLVDSFVKWRIRDVQRYYTSVGGDETATNVRLLQVIKDGLRGEFGKRTIQNVVSGERTQIMALLSTEANKVAQGFGIDVIDVRIKRIDLPREVSTSVYRRMEAERERVAKDLRSLGAEAAERIRADADRQREVTLAEAFRDAEQIRGEGDAVATNIYASAYGRNPEFFSFYRSLAAYRTAFRDNKDILILSQDAPFFRFFQNARGAPAPAPPAAR